jgi:hypothetical protein
MLGPYSRTNRRLGGESNREIVSFRVVRACVRARGADSEVGFGRKSGG